MTDDNAPARKSHRRMLDHLGGSQARREAIQGVTDTYDPSAPQNAPQTPTTPPPKGSE